VTPSSEFESILAATVNQLAAAEGFDPQSHRLDVLGLCSECSQPARRPTGQTSRRLLP
jgi:Fe2+ or Zn2+ uptake regulation protein